ncbi:MAG: hypothetical protein MJ090_02895 [Clostridia bacterium]|nr:hypothetical protein [Clostridia bacterium]
MQEKEIKVRPFFAKCIIIESVTVVLVLLSVVLIRFTSKPLFSKLKDLYIKYVLDETSVSEVLEDKGKYEV